MNGPHVRTQATMSLPPSRGTSEVHLLRSPLLPREATTTPDVSWRGIWCVSYRAWSPFLMSAMRSTTRHYSFVSPSGVPPLKFESHSPTTYTYGPPSKQAPSAALMPIMRIAFFRFPLANLADITSRFSHFFTTYFEDPLNPPYIIASATHSRRHASVTCVGMSMFVSPLPSNTSPL